MPQQQASNPQDAHPSHTWHRELVYEPLDTLLVRVPLLPIQQYLHLGTSSDCIALYNNDPAVRRALAAGSIALFDELERESVHAKDRRQRERTLLRYLMRMSTRPTPYGLFAGVALAHWGEVTDLSLDANARRIHARPDMEWLLRLLWSLEALPEVQYGAQLCTNSAAVIRRGKAFLLEGVYSGEAKPRKNISLKATSVVVRALELASKPISYHKLAQTLLASTPGATPQKVDQLLATLLRHTFLITDLRPPLTISDPVAYILERLASIPEVAQLYEALLNYTNALRDWESITPEASLKEYRSLLNEASSIQQMVDALRQKHGIVSAETASQRDAVSSNVVQVDQTFTLSGEHVARSLGEEIARAVEILLCMSPVADGYPYLATYREAFLRRYGEQRAVPLLEVLDPYFGLGLPPLYLEKLGQETPPKLEQLSAQRDQVLTRLALTALRHRQRVVSLDEDLLAELEPVALSQKRLPPSLDVYVLAAALSLQALTSGAYTLVIGPNVGVQQAGRNLGRFAHQLGPQAIEALKQGADHEEALTPGTIWAELIYTPQRTRLTNVAIRPGVRHYEIPYAIVSTDAQTIPLDELVVGIRDDRWYLHWPAQGKDVIISAGHMLNPIEAPPLARFLSDLAQDRTVQLYPFYWGTAEAFPFLPRVQFGRVVLRPAQWTITTNFHRDAFLLENAEGFLSSLERWMADWNVPRYIYMGEGDHRLLLDLLNPLHASELRTALKRLERGEVLLLQEGIPGPEDAWMPGPQGHYLTEFVISLARRQTTSAPESTQSAPPITLSKLTDSPLSRVKPPGSDWLFLQLYCAAQLQDDLIAGSLRAFVQDMLTRGYAEDWFFLRYSDPEPHLRLRFRGKPELLMSHLLPCLISWATHLLSTGSCVNYSLNIYEREIERYGGPQGIEAAEALFGADSHAVVEILHLYHTHVLSLDRSVLAVFGMDDLLGHLGMTAEQRWQWCRTHIPRKQEAGRVYRQKSRELRFLLAHAEHPVELPDMLRQIFMVRGKVIQQVAQHLSTKVAPQSLDDIYGSYLHMFCNRLLGLNREAEIEALQLLLRTRESLGKGPLIVANRNSSWPGKQNIEGAL